MTGVQTCALPISCRGYRPWRGWKDPCACRETAPAEDREETAAKKGERQRIFSSALYNAYSHFGYRTATQAIYSTQARHTCAAQHVFLCQSATTAGCEYSARVKNLRGTVMPRLRKVAGMCSSNIAEMRICGYHAEEEILCRSLFFYAYAVYHSHPR